MALVSGPALSLAASGSVGNITFFKGRGGRQIARLRTKPSNPNSPLQSAARQSLGNLAKVYSGGGTPSTLTIGATVAAVLYTARKGGIVGQSIRVTHIDPVGNNAALAVTVVGQDITVNLATDGASVATSTAAQVRSAVNAHLVARELVLAGHPAGQVGSGLAVAAAFAPLAGGVDAGPFLLRRVDRSVFPATFADDSVAILTVSEKASWIDMQDFIKFNAPRLSSNLPAIRVKA